MRVVMILSLWEKCSGVADEYLRKQDEVPLSLKSQIGVSDEKRVCPWMKNQQRWKLLLAALLQFGNFYAYETPAALNTQLQSHLQMDYDEWQIILGLLFSAYSVPNMIIPLVGGSYVDGVDGPRRVMVVSTLLIVLGQGLFHAGIVTKCVWVSVLGRLVVGIGGETNTIAQTVILSHVFDGDTLLFAMAVCLCVGKLGSIANALISPSVGLQFGVEIALLIATAACVVSFVAAVVLFGSLAKLDETSPTEATPLLASHTVENFSGSINRPICDSESSSLGGSTAMALSDASTLISENGQSTLDTISCLPLSFWILCLLFACHATFYSFNNTASDFLMSRWFHNDPVTAGFVMSLPSTASSILIPIFGSFLNTNANGLVFLTASFVAACFVHLVLGYTLLNPIIPLLAMGASGAVNATLIYPFVTYVVRAEEDRLLREERIEKRMMGTGCGICTCSMNIALSVLPMCVAGMMTGFGVYKWEALQSFFAGVSLVGAALSFALIVYCSRRRVFG
ncbi:hypothetical protein HDU77_005159 [Chytriomyces hyalinus]|nr:hypothetical protein HDU77_005159 [Chytriomyces hyalinus]